MPSHTLGLACSANVFGPQHRQLQHTLVQKHDLISGTCLQPKFFKGKYQDTNTFVKLPLQMATEREIARQQYTLAGRSLADWTVRLKDFPHPALDAASLVGQVIGPFLFAASMFSYVPVVSHPPLPSTFSLFKNCTSAFWCLQFRLTLTTFGLSCELDVNIIIIFAALHRNGSVTLTKVVAAAMAAAAEAADRSSSCTCQLGPSS